MKTTRAPAAAGAILYHSMLIHVSTCPTSFHQLYSTMKLAMVLVEPRMSANSTASRIRLRIGEGRIRTRISVLEPRSAAIIHQSPARRAPRRRVPLRGRLGGHL